MLFSTEHAEKHSDLNNSPLPTAYLPGHTVNIPNKRFSPRYLPRFAAPDQSPSQTATLSHSGDLKQAIAFQIPKRTWPFFVAKVVQNSLYNPLGRSAVAIRVFPAGHIVVCRCIRQEPICFG